MKNIILIAFVFTSLLGLSSCEKDYPEEVTYSGKNTHGFKLNGEEWVALNRFPCIGDNNNKKPRL